MKGLPMQSFSAVRRRSKRLIAGLPFDLIGVVGVAAVATAVLTVFDVSAPLVRAAIGFPLLFLAPGYVTVSVLFPRATPVRESALDGPSFLRQTRDVTDLERLALSFGMSLALLPLLGLAIAGSPWSFTGPVVGATVAGFSAIGAVVASVRRLFVPASERYRVGFRRRLGAARAAIFGGESVLHVAVNVALVVSMVLALTAVGYALVAPQQGEQYTSLQLLTENESGELVASGYPEEIDPTESVPFVVGLENREGEAMNYTVVVQEQRLEDGEVVERTELDRFDTRLESGETAHADRIVTPTADAGTVRISVLVFTDSVPETPTQATAYRYGHFWTTVTGGGDLEATVEDDADEDDADDGADDEDDGDDDSIFDFFDDDDDEDEDDGDSGDEEDDGDSGDEEDGGDSGDEEDSGDSGDEEDDGDSGDEEEEA